LNKLRAILKNAKFARPARHTTPPRKTMATLQLYGIWFLLSIGVAGAALAWSLM